MYVRVCMYVCMTMCSTYSIPCMVLILQVEVIRLQQLKFPHHLLKQVVAVRLLLQVEKRHNITENA